MLATSEVNGKDFLGALYRVRHWITQLSNVWGFPMDNRSAFLGFKLPTKNHGYPLAVAREDTKDISLQETGGSQNSLFY